MTRNTQFRSRSQGCLRPVVVLTNLDINMLTRQRGKDNQLLRINFDSGLGCCTSTSFFVFPGFL